MRFGQALSIAAWILLAATHSLAGQLVPGARVRIRPRPDSDRVDGTIIARDADSMVVATLTGAQHRVALTSLSSVDLYRGRSRMAGAKKGAVWGAVVIAVPLALALAASDPERDHWPRSDQLRFSFYLIRLYAVTGATIGVFVRADSWQRCERVTSPTCGSRP